MPSSLPATSTVHPAARVTAPARPGPRWFPISLAAALLAVVSMAASLTAAPAQGADSPAADGTPVATPRSDAAGWQEAAALVVVAATAAAFGFAHWRRRQRPARACGSSDGCGCSPAAGANPPTAAPASPPEPVRFTQRKAAPAPGSGPASGATR